MPEVVQKVTAFILRRSRGRRDLLLIRHPHAGVQIPAGTVEDGESPEAAALREAAEESSLNGFTLRQALGAREEVLPQGEAAVAAWTHAYARPDLLSFDWAYLRPGITVSVLRRAAGFTQVRYEEFDQVPDPSYVTMSITGWVPDHALAYVRVRHFFLLEPQSWTPDEPWQVRADNHVFTLFWAPLGALPPIIPPQDRWLEVLDAALEK